MRRRIPALLLFAVIAALLPPVGPPTGEARADVRHDVRAETQLTASSTTIDEQHVPVFPGLVRRQLTLRLDDGSRAVAQILEFHAADPSLQLRPHLARGTVAGLETVPAMGARLLPAGGVAGINGGFWLNNPVGDPNGYYAVDEELVSEAQTQGAGPRGTVASLPDGRLLMDRISSTQEVTVGGSPAVRVVGVNRYHSSTPPFPDGSHATLVYTPAFSAAVAVRAVRDAEGTALPVRALVVDGLRLPASGTALGRVTAVTTGEQDMAIPPGGAVVVAHGDHASQLAGAATGDVAAVRVALQPATTDAATWTQLRHGLAAGPLIVQRGQRTDPGTWEGEGFSARTHSDVRHPRSAIGWTADGRVLLVTVDGRRPGHSAGMTMHELSHLLLLQGAVEGLALDGGGSTQMATDGQTRNRPCCDASLRPVATGLYVHHSYEFTATERLSGASRAGTAAAIAAASHPGGAQEVLLATQGTFADALAGGPLAVRRDAPLLLTGRDTLPPETAAALEQLRPRRVTVLGGGGAISEALAQALGTRYAVRRISGADRFATAAELGRMLGPGHPRVFLVTGRDFPDALSASAPAGMLGMPVLLTGTDVVPDATLRVLREAGTREVVIAGGAAAVSQRVVDQLRRAGYLVTRLSGPSRYATARRVNEWARSQLTDLDTSGLVVALGERFPDALAGGPLAAQRRQLLTLVPAVDIDRDPDAGAFLRERAGELERATLLGGHAALSSYQHWQVDQLVR